MSNSRNHGGKRKGAGRPRKWSFDDILTIGQECEKHFRAAVRADSQSNKKALISNEVVELGSHYQHAQEILAENKKAIMSHDTIKGKIGSPEARAVLIKKMEKWVNDKEGGVQHIPDVSEEIVSLNEMIGTEKPNNRVFQITGKAPKGTRSHIIKIVAEEYDLKTSEVDNLWQQYRRFESEA